MFKHSEYVYNAGRNVKILTFLDHYCRAGLLSEFPVTARLAYTK
jgi:hypothetical protein